MSCPLWWFQFFGLKTFIQNSVQFSQLPSLHGGSQGQPPRSSRCPPSFLVLLHLEKKLWKKPQPKNMVENETQFPCVGYLKKGEGSILGPSPQHSSTPFEWKFWRIAFPFTCVNNGGCATAAGKEFGQIFDSPFDGPNKRELSNYVSETK